MTPALKATEQDKSTIRNIEVTIGEISVCRNSQNNNDSNNNNNNNNNSNNNHCDNGSNNSEHKH